MNYLRRLTAVALLALTASGSALALTPSAFQVLFSGGWWLPGASVDMNFAQAKYYGCDISCISVSRASTGYAQTSSGLLVPFGSNVARITDQGLLVEEARTNLLLQSQTFTNASWVGSSGAVVTGSFGSSPDGTTTSARLNVTAGTTHQPRLRQDITLAASQTHTYTIYVKSNTGGNQTLALAFTQDGVADHFQDITATTAWQRFQFTQAFGAGGAGTANIGFANDASGNAFDVQVWGAQLEANTSFATSLIPTTTASATRAADNVTAAGGLLALLTSSAYSYNVKAVSNAVNTGTARYILASSDGTLNNRISTFVTAATNTSFRHISAGVGASPGDISSNWPTAGLAQNIGRSVSSSSDTSYANGAQQTTSSPSAIPSTTMATIGQSEISAAAYFNGYFQRIIGWSAVKNLTGVNP